MVACVVGYKTMENRVRIFLCLSSCILGFADPSVGELDGFARRRHKLLKMLTSAAMLEGDIDSLGYSYRRRWQYYNACLGRDNNREPENRRVRPGFS